jgi:hypothetical protein
MRRATLLAAAALAVGLAAGEAAAAPPALRCRHTLAMARSSADLPPSVTASLRPWMALRGERWSKTDAVGPGTLVAGYQWGARSGPIWLVAYRVGGIACCRTRFAVFKPQGAGYRWLTKGLAQPDFAQQVTCADVDRLLDSAPQAQ